MERITVSVEPSLLDQTQEALGAPSKTETIRIALEETLRRKRLAGVLENMGQIELDLDQETLARLREEG